ncbi:hypothetical protein LJR230_000297 [Trinickia sp. LjRoot230]|uniref:hypothetical protein n=1 Tax=Trinickia sp. LjRoot230 TaxID=3342288 RepID=UPI003ECDA3C6
MSTTSDTATLTHGEADATLQQISGIQTTNSPALSKYKHALWLACLQNSQYATASFASAAWTVAPAIKSNNQSGPPALADLNGTLYLVHRADVSDDLYCMKYDGTTWSAESWMFQAKGMPAATTLGAAAYGKTSARKLYIAWRDATNGNAIGINSGDGQTAWPSGNPQYVPGVSTSQSPALAVYNKKLFLIYTASDSTNYIHYKHTADGTTWKAPEGVVQDSATKLYASTTRAPAVTTFDGKLWVVYVDGSNHLSFATFDGTGWTLLGSLTSLSVTDSPAVATYTANGHAYLFCAARDSDGNIWWLSVAASAAKNITGYVTRYTFGSEDDPSAVSFEITSKNGTPHTGSMVDLSDASSTGYTAIFVMALANGYEVVALDSHIDFNEYSGVKLVQPTLS